jgi:cell division protein FtsZ
MHKEFDDAFINSFDKEEEDEVVDKERELELEIEQETYSKREKANGKSTSLIDRLKGTDRKKKKAEEPVSESNVDNWFFKNFGKIFDDEEDQPLR